MSFASAEAIDQAVARSRANGRAMVRVWLIGLAALVVVMVGVGGATRLTGSGLAITEWRPVTGAVPPFTQEAWLAEFAKYRRIPQYELVNRGMSLAEFKVIYWWEWTHRQLGRMIGIAFFVPLAWFWLKGMVRGRLAVALLGVGALGALQGAVGWVMVASGLEPGMTAVAPLKLALHLTLAGLILSALVWLATGLEGGRKGAARNDGDSRTVRAGAYLLLGLIMAQIALGGLVAGSRAGWTYNTWPLMDGNFIPPAAVLFAGTPFVENFVNNPALVQFNHRLVALLLVSLSLWHAYIVARRWFRSPAARRAGALAMLIVLQAGLGILTLLLVVPLWAGLGHQLVAMGLLAFATVHAHRCAAEQVSAEVAPASNRT